MPPMPFFFGSDLIKHSIWAFLPLKKMAGVGDFLGMTNPSWIKEAELSLVGQLLLLPGWAPVSYLQTLPAVPF